MAIRYVMYIQMIQSVDIYMQKKMSENSVMATVDSCESFKI